MNSGPLRVALIQQACVSDSAENLAVTIDGVRSAAAQGAGLMLLQELHTRPYFCQTEDPACFDLAEPIPGPTSTRLADLARELGVVIVSSLFERRGSGIYHNTAIVLDRDGELAGCYRKMHIPDDPGYYEKFYFSPGDTGFRPIETSLGRLGVLVCWDQWFPEAARLMALAEADLLLYPSAIGWDPNEPAAEQVRQQQAWQTVQQAHAIANALPVMVCNRTGFEPDPSGHTDGIEFWGRSFLCGPQGEILAQAASDGNAVLIAEVDLRRTEQVRRSWPFLRDRRIDAYAGLLERYGDPVSRRSAT